RGGALLVTSTWPTPYARPPTPEELNAGPRTAARRERSVRNAAPRSALSSAERHLDVVTGAPESEPRGGNSVILLLSTSDTDLLSARSCGADYRLANPARLELSELPGLLDGASIVVVRILGTERTWAEGLRIVRESGSHVVVLGGEQSPDAELMERSTVTVGIATEAHTYLTLGGPDNLAQLHRSLSDTLLLTGHGFVPPAPQPSWGVLFRESSGGDGPVVSILYYRAHHLSGNTAFVHTLADQVEAAGGRALPIYCASLRSREPEMMAELEK